MTLDPGRRDQGPLSYAPPGAPGSPGAPAPRRSSGPSGRTWFLSLLGSAAAATVVGLLVGLLRSGSGEVTTASAPLPTPTATRSSTASAAASAGPSTVASPSGSPSPSAKPTPSPDAAMFIQDPTKDKGLDFAVVTGVKQDGDLVALRVDRLTFLTGDAAKKYYDEHPDQERLDYAIVNQNPKQFTYTLVPNAPVFGAQVLTGNPQASPISQQQLVAKLKESLAAKQAVYIWLRHQDGGKGWTTYVAEQYLP